MNTFGYELVFHTGTKYPPWITRAIAAGKIKDQPFFGRNNLIPHEVRVKIIKAQRHLEKYGI